MIIILIAYILTGYIYEDSDSLIVINDTLVICGDHDYAQMVHITDHSLILVRPWLEGSDSLGRLVLSAPLITIQDSSVLNGSFRGYSGGDNSDPHGFGPGYGGAGNPGGGGGAGYGGDGGQGGDNAPGPGGSAYGDPADTLIERGSGGGAGRLGSVDGYGGNGGAAITLRAQNVIIDSSDFASHGERGDDGGLEAGGGGSGGGILIWGGTVMIDNVTFGANGGNGADAAFGGGGGASGGRIKIFYETLLDTAQVSFSVAGGSPGSGAYGTPEPGMSGTIHIRHIMLIAEQSRPHTRAVMVCPTLSRGNITLQTAEIPTTIALYDCTGQRVKTVCVWQTRTDLDVTDLDAGIYFVRTRESKSITKIIVLE